MTKTINLKKTLTIGVVLALGLATLIVTNAGATGSGTFSASLSIGGSATFTDGAEVIATVTRPAPALLTVTPAAGYSMSIDGAPAVTTAVTKSANSNPLAGALSLVSVVFVRTSDGLQYDVTATYGAVLTVRSITWDWTKTLPVVDADGDGVLDDVDNCPLIANAGQENFDGDSEGDACDADDDNDTVADTSDLCAMTVADAGAPEDANDQYVNHHKWFGGTHFSTKLPDKSLASSYSISDTRGCSSKQILEAQGVDSTSALYTKGSPKGHVESWISSVSGL